MIRYRLRIDPSHGPSRGALDWAKNTRGGKMFLNLDSVSSLRLKSRRAAAGAGERTVGAALATGSVGPEKLVAFLLATSLE